jgi:hypothetical protein
VVSLLALAAIYSTFQSQHQSYQLQRETADMQQNIRTAMYYMQREIRMAGSDPFNKGAFGITAANATSITFTEDVGGNNTGDPPDGDVADPGENITYQLDTNRNLVRIDNTVAPPASQIVAQNIDALDFVYLDGSSAPLNSGGGGVPAPLYSEIQSVEITIVARTGDQLFRGTQNNNTYKNQQGYTIYNANDYRSRRILTTLVNCRNIGL